MKIEFTSKLDLGESYFPNLEPRSARQKLCELIHSDLPLFRKLKKTGYKKSARQFSPAQVQLIMERLGKPW